MDEMSNWKTRALIIGAVIGAITGLGAAYIMIRRAEEAQSKPQLTTGDGVKNRYGTRRSIKTNIGYWFQQIDQIPIKKYSHITGVKHDWAVIDDRP